MDTLYQRMQESHNGALAQDTYINAKLNTQHQRSDHHRGRLNFLACDQIELVDLEILRLCGENNKLKAKVASMAEYLCQCSPSSPALSGEGTVDSPFKLDYESNLSYHLVPIVSNCLSCAVPLLPKNDELIPVLPPKLVWRM